MAKHRRRTMKGGFLDTLSSWGSSFTQSASSLWGKPKQTTTTSLFGSTTPTTSNIPTTSNTPTTTSIAPPITQQASYGGRTRRRRMRGGYRDNISSTNLAADAAHFSGPTAKPHNWVGGRTRRRSGGKKGAKKSYRHRK